VAFMSGTKPERQRARRYLGWLLKQRSGGVRIDDASRMTDVTVVHVPQNCMGAVSGSRGAALRHVEVRERQENDEQVARRTGW
jgi:hypothetical protein